MHLLTTQYFKKIYSDNDDNKSTVLRKTASTYLYKQQIQSNSIIHDIIVIFQRPIAWYKHNYHIYKSMNQWITQKSISRIKFYTVIKISTISRKIYIRVHRKVQVCRKKDIFVWRSSEYEASNNSQKNRETLSKMRMRICETEQTIQAIDYLLGQ